MALNYNTIIYRLYVRPPQPAFAFSGRYIGNEASKFRDVVGVTINDAGLVMLGHKGGVSMFDAKAAFVKSVTAEDPSAFFVDEKGRVVTVRRDSLIAEGGDYAAIAIPQKDGKLRPADEIPAVIAAGERRPPGRRSQRQSGHPRRDQRQVPQELRHAQRRAHRHERARGRGDAGPGHQVDRHHRSRRQAAAARSCRRAPATSSTTRSTSRSIRSAISTCSIAASRSLYVFSARAKLLASFTLPEKDPGIVPEAAGVRARRRRPRLSVRRSIPADPGISVMSIRKIVVALLAAWPPRCRPVSRSRRRPIPSSPRPSGCSMRSTTTPPSARSTWPSPDSRRKAVNDPARRELLPAAYEMRARSKFGLGDQNGAKADFVALLKINAGHALTGQVSPRVVALFEEAVKATVTNAEPDGHAGDREDPDRRRAGSRQAARCRLPWASTRSPPSRSAIARRSRPSPPRPEPSPP